MKKQEKEGHREKGNWKAYSKKKNTIPVVGREINNFFGNEIRFLSYDNCAVLF